MSTHFPDFVALAADDQVEADRLLVAVIHLGDQDRGAFQGVQTTLGQGLYPVMHQSLAAQADDIGDDAFLQPADVARSGSVPIQDFFEQSNLFRIMGFSGMSRVLFGQLFTSRRSQDEQPVAT